MALTYPAFNALSEQARAELRRRVPAVDPTVYGSFTRALLDSAAALSYSDGLLIRDLDAQLFPQTSFGDYLDQRWADYEGFKRNPASPSEGFAALPGTVGTVIPAGTIFTSNGQNFEASAATSIQTIAQSVSSVTRTGSIATVTTAADHAFATGLEVTISGASQAEYNGAFAITAIAANQFTYDVSGTPASPASGTISASGVFAKVKVNSTGTGQSTNLPGGAVLSLQSAIAGAEASAFVLFDGVTGGADIEDDEALRRRVLLSRSLIEGVFTPDQVRLAALSISGNTRAFVIRPSLSVADPAPAPGMVPAPGQTVVYILRDNDANPIPSATVLANTKQRIIERGALPANTSPLDLFVFAPIAVPVNFTFTSLSPDTPTMQEAVRNQLKAFFEDKVDFQQALLEPAYLGEIQNTQDLITGEFLKSFELSAPLGNVAIGAGQIATLGTVSFA